MSLSDSHERSPHYYIEVDDLTVDQLKACVYDLNEPGEPMVFGPCSYQEARAWCFEHGDPEAGE